MNYLTTLRIYYTLIVVGKKLFQRFDVITSILFSKFMFFKQVNFYTVYTYALQFKFQTVLYRYKLN